MHDGAWRFVSRIAETLSVNSVLEVGSRNINGSIRPLFFAVTYTGLDVLDGPGVDVVADAATWSTDQTFDCVVCCEVAEHAPEWRKILINTASFLREGGRYIFTAAGEGRAEHSGIDGGALRDGEYYGNVSESDLREALEEAGLSEIVIECEPGDIYATAVK